MLRPKSKTHLALELSTDVILPNPNQPRKTFDAESLTELALSIKELGILQPVIVRRGENGSYILVAGERRYRAALLANQKTIPAIVRNTDEKNTAIIALTENLQRENLTYFEEALAYASLIEDFHFSQMEIAKMVGKQQSTISNKIRLLSLPDEIKNLLTRHHLTERHARALLSIQTPDLQKQVIQAVIEQGLNISQTETLIASLSGEDKKEIPPAAKKRQPKTSNYQFYINTLKKAFGSIKKVSSNAEYIQKDRGDFVEVKIRIPKEEKESQSAAG